MELKYSHMKCSFHVWHLNILTNDISDSRVKEWPNVNSNVVFLDADEAHAFTIPNIFVEEVNSFFYKTDTCEMSLEAG